MKEMDYNSIVEALTTEDPSIAAKALILKGMDISSEQMTGIIDALVNSGRFVANVDLSGHELTDSDREKLAIFLFDRGDVSYKGSRLPDPDTIVINEWPPKDRISHDCSNDGVTIDVKSDSNFGKSNIKAWANAMPKPSTAAEMKAAFDREPRGRSYKAILSEVLKDGGKGSAGIR